MKDDEIRDLLEKATPGPWDTGYHGTHEVQAGNVLLADCGVLGNARADARLMAAAPELAYDLILIRNDLAEHEAALAEIHAACVAAGIPEETVSETGTTTRHRTAQLVAWMAEELAKARAKIAAYEGDEADGWVVYHPEQGMEWFSARADADAYAVELMTDMLHDQGEAHDNEAVVMRVVAHTQQVVQATSGDDSEDGEWCRERGVDYLVGGYRIADGSGVVEVPDEG